MNTEQHLAKHYSSVRARLMGGPKVVNNLHKVLTEKKAREEELIARGIFLMVGGTDTQPPLNKRAAMRSKRGKIYEHDVRPLLQMRREGRSLFRTSNTILIHAWCIQSFYSGFDAVEASAMKVENAADKRMRGIIAETICAMDLQCSFAEHVYIQRRFYNEDVIASVIYAIREADASYTYKDIGEAIGVSESTIKQRCRDYVKAKGLEPIRHAHNTKWTSEMIAKASELWKQGLPAADIGREVGLSRVNVLTMAHRRRELFPMREQGLEAAA